MQEQKDNENKKSIVFSWQHNEFDQLLKSCERTDDVAITLKYLKNKNWKILETGCGLGRVVKYLYDKGLKNIYGIEINQDSVAWLNKSFPDLNIEHGDILNMKYPLNSFDMVLSYGLIEHFPDGPDAPLNALYNVLKPGGIGIITVPSFNLLRRISYALSFIDPRKNNLVRKAFSKPHRKWNRKRFSYYIDPQRGNFFEYRFTPKQFETVCKRAGFDIIESTPIAHIDGLFHSVFRPFVSFKNWEFKVSKSGVLLNKLFKKVPFLHNHMHACVVRKPVNEK